MRRAEQRRRAGKEAKGTRPGGSFDWKLPPAGWIAAAAVLVAIVVVAVVVLGKSSGSGEKPVSFTGSGYPNVDLSNTRDVGGPIDKGNVTKLQSAWTAPITGKSNYGSDASTPVIAGGVVYSQDLASNVQALSLQTGKVLWSKSYESPDNGPNGVVVGDGEVLGATSESAFALDEKTGRQIWSVKLVRNEREGIDMAPGYHDGIVYVSTVPGNTSSFYAGEGVGILWALNAKTGRKLWHFDTAPEDLWSPSTTSIDSGGGVWYPPAFDSEGSMYIGTANPGPMPGTEEYPWGSSRPGPNLYTDSIVKLNAKTGKLEWYYQLTPHDLYDWDLQDPPILLDAGGKHLVIGAGKSGIVIALNRETGKLVWKRPVGTHNGHDRDGLYAMRHEYSKLKMPETVYPGELGGVIAPMASDGSTIYAPVVNFPVHFTSQTANTEGPTGTGELVAIEAATGKVKWKQQLPSLAFGAVTVVKDLVLTTSFEGSLEAFDASTGEMQWRTQLPAGTNAGVTVSGNTLLAPAGRPTSESQEAALVAYRLPSR